MGNMSDEAFIEHLMTDNQGEDYVQMLSNKKEVSNTYNLTIRKAKMFDTTLRIAEKIDFPHKAVYIAAVALILIIIGAIFISGLKMLGIV